MLSLQNPTLYVIMTVTLFSGCTQVVTAPVSVAGSVVGTTIGVAGSTVNALTTSDEEEQDD